MGQMRRRGRAWIAVVVALSAAVALGLTFCEASPPEPAAPASGASTAASMAAVDEPAHDRAHARRVGSDVDDETDVDADEIAPTSLSGTVSCGDAPLQGATVDLTRVAAELGGRRFGPEDFSSTGWAPDLAETVASTTTDAAGRFTLPAPPEGLFVVIARAKGCGPGIEWAHDDWLDLDLRRGCELTATVTDREGVPIAGARVALDAGRGAHPAADVVRTDASGRFAVVLSGEDDLVVSAPGFAVREIQDALERGSAPIVLERALPIAGHVVDADGAPVGGAVVHCDENRHALLVTGPDGAFGWDDFPADGTYVGLSAFSRGRMRADAWASPGQTDVRIVLQRPATLVVTLVDEDGVRLDRGSVVVRGPRANRDVRVSSDGSAELGGLRAQTVKILGQRRGAVEGAPWPVITHQTVVEAHVVAGETTRVEVCPALLPVAFVRVRIVDEEGRPLAGALVRRRGPVTGGGDTTTEADGLHTHALGIEPGDPAEIRVRRADDRIEHEITVATVARPDAPPVDVAVPRRRDPDLVEVTLRMTGDLPDPLPAGAGFWTSPPDSFVNAAGASPPSATVRMPAGRPFKASAMVPGMADVLVAGAAPARGGLELVFAMRPEAVVAGRVVLASGVPYPAVTVKVDVQRADGVPQQRRVQAEEISSDARFAVRAVPAGPALIGVEDARGTIVWERAIELVSGETLDLGDLVVGDLPRVFGAVRDELGEPLAGAVVSAWAADSGVLAETSTAPDGTFVLLTPVRDGARLHVRHRPTDRLLVRRLTADIVGSHRTFVVPRAGTILLRTAPGSEHTLHAEARRAADGLRVTHSRGYNNTSDGRRIVRLDVPPGVYDVVLYPRTERERTYRALVEPGVETQVDVRDE